MLIKRSTTALGAMRAHQHCAFAQRPSTSGRGRVTRSQQSDEAPTAPAAGKKERELGLGLKAAWVGAELFGDAAAALSGNKAAATAAATDAPGRPRTVEETVASIKSDYDLDYFISGAAAMDSYADSCRFSDDFAAFEGAGATPRFKKNVANLGALLSNVKIDVDSDWQVVDNRLTTNWRFQGIIKGLPWKPLLAAAGSTTHVIDPSSGLVVEHIERWKADPKEVVLRLLRPARTPPGTAWETFMLSLSDGDFQGMWFVLSPRTIPFTGAVCLASLVAHLATGDGLPGSIGSGLEAFSFFLLPTSLVTEVVKFSQGLQGGETGTGGRF